MTTPSELADISAAIHDEYFEIERLEHDADRAELRLPIFAGRRKKWWVLETDRPEDPPPPPIGTLVVRNVTGISVEDKADIGWYDVGRLEYEAGPTSYGLSRTCPPKSWCAPRSWRSSFSVESDPRAAPPAGPSISDASAKKRSVLPTLGAERPAAAAEGPLDRHVGALTPRRAWRLQLTLR